MAVHRDVGGPGIVARGLNIAYCAPVQQVRNILRDIGPTFSSIPRDLNKAIVGARPNRACFLRRLRDSENRPRVFHTDVVRSQPAGNSLPAFVVSRQVRTDNLPTVATVCCDVNKLASYIKLVVVVRRNRDGEFPIESVLRFRCGRSCNIFGPDLDFSRLAIPFIKSCQRAADTPGARATGPDNVVVHRIGSREPAFASAHRMPDAAWNLSALAPASASKTSELQTVTGSAIRRPVLLVPINEIGNLVIQRHMINLCDRQ